MNKFYKIWFLIVLVFSFDSVFSQIDTACLGDRGQMYSFNNSSPNYAVNVWTVENEGNGVSVQRLGDTVRIDWLKRQPGMYTISVQEFNVFYDGIIDTITCEGLPVYDSVLVWGPTDLDIGDDQYVCEGNSFEFLSNNVYNRYLWSNGTTNRSSNYNTEGTVWLEIADSTNCTMRDSTYLTIKTLPKPELGPDVSICDENVMNIRDLNNSGVAYIWYKKDIETDTGFVNYSTEFELNVTEDDIWQKGIDSIKVEAIDYYGCKNTDKVYLMMCPNLLGSVPTIITPNNDGDNDVWKIDRLIKYPQNYPDLIVEIFDRWGKLVWRSNPGYINNPWGGNDFRGKKLPMDSYFYVIKWTYFNQVTNKNDVMELPGHITIIR